MLLPPAIIVFLAQCWHPYEKKKGEGKKKKAHRKSTKHQVAIASESLQHCPQSEMKAPREYGYQQSLSTYVMLFSYSINQMGDMGYIWEPHKCSSILPKKWENTFFTYWGMGNGERMIAGKPL